MQRILVIRRDNIGDLACTTPMIHLLRRHFPNAWIGALVTHYNASVLAGNADLDEVLHYRKAKHLARGESRLGAYWARLRQILALRAMRLDCVILPAAGEQASAQRLARWLAPKRILTAAPEIAPRHEVERCAAVLAPLGINDPPPAMRLTADATTRQKVIDALATRNIAPTSPRVGIHISARKPNQRWPEQHFAQLMTELHQRHGASFVLVWSPGAENNPMHPGDDEKAARLIDLTRHLPVLAYPTHALPELIAALDVCDSVVCSDGGAMHLAAALGKPMVCFFGSTNPALWAPWGVQHRLLQPPSRNVCDIAPEAALAAWESLAGAAAGGIAP